MKKIILIITYLLLFVYAKSQETGETDLPENDASVSFSTGAPTINIPLLSAQSGNISASVGLYYSTNGVGVQENESNAGMSWQFYGNGSIIQEVKGANDFKQVYGYYFSDILAQYSEDQKHQLMTNTLDAEPDLFYINTPYISGQFAYHQGSNKFIFLTENNCKIEYTEHFSDINYFYNGTFKITDETGTKYYFEKVVKNITYICEGVPSYSYEWLLTKVQSVNSDDEIVFNYKQPQSGSFSIGGINYLKYNYTILKMKLGSNYEFYDGATMDYENTSTSTGYLIKPLVELENITTKNAKINLVYGEYENYNFLICDDLNETIDLQDFLQGESLIKNIVYSKLDDELITKYIFNYEEHNDKNFLTHIEIQNSENDYNNPYFFEYYSLQNITNDIDKQDIWGYYSENSNFLYLNRLPDINNVSTGMLKKITYPSGSNESFYYEPNSYCLNCTGWINGDWQTDMITAYGSSLDQKNIIGPGVRVCKTIKTDGSDNITTEYGYQSDDLTVTTESSGRLINYPMFKYSISNYQFQFMPFPHGYEICTVTFKDKNSLNYQTSYVIYEKIKVFDSGKIIESGTEKGINGSVRYSYNVELPEKINAPDLPFNVEFSKIKNGSLKSVEVFDKNNIIKSSTEYEYESGESAISFPGKKIIAYHYCNPYDDTPGAIQCDRDEFFLSTYLSPQQYLNLKKEITKTYDNTGNSIEAAVNYEYTSTKKYLNKSFYTTGSGDTYTTYYYYPGDAAYTTDDYLSMTNLNIFSIPVKTETKLKKSGSSNEITISGQETLFSTENGKILPDTLKAFDGNIIWKTVEIYDEYDEDLNLLQSHSYDNVYSSTIYGYDNTLPIASVTNARKDKIRYLNFEENYDLIWTPHYSQISLDETKFKTGQKSLRILANNWVSTQIGGLETNNKYTIGVWVFSIYQGIELKVQNGAEFIDHILSEKSNEWEYLELSFTKPEGEITVYIVAGGSEIYIDDLRFYPADAYMTTTTYEPLVGVTSVTDANNNSAFYEYDSWGRQTELRNKDFALISTFEYEEFTYQPIDFTIGGVTAIANENFSMSVALNGTYEFSGDIIWEWFMDEIDQQADAYGQNTVFNICKPTTFYVRPVYNNFSYPCKESYVSPSTQIQFSDDLIFIHNETPKSVDILSNGCGDWTVGSIPSWMEIQYLDDNTFSIKCTQTSFLQTDVLTVQTENSLIDNMTVKCTPSLSFDPTDNIALNKITFCMNVTGGYGNYIYTWYKDDELQSNAESDCFTMNNTTSYDVTCIVTDDAGNEVDHEWSK